MAFILIGEGAQNMADRQQLAILHIPGRKLGFWSRFFAAMFKNLLLMAVLLSSASLSVAQEKQYLNGLLLDAMTEEPVGAAHIINFSDSLATISSTEGLFKLQVTAGDSIFISCIGYHPKALVADEAHVYAELVVIRLSSRSYQLAEVEVNPFGSKSEFQKRFMELSVDDGTIDIVGIQQPTRAPRAIPITEDADEIKKAKYLLNPASFIYGNLSKDAKARQELHRLREEDRKHGANRYRYNEQVVAKITGYEGERVREFMDFCNFSDSQIYQMNDYQLAVMILNRQREFEARGNRSDR